jgi:hypothetical protein
MSCWRLGVAALLGLASIAWLTLWAHRALLLWAADYHCVMIAGPFLRCGPGALAWQAPLIVALLPVALLGLWCALRRIAKALRQGVQGWRARRRAMRDVAVR